MSETKGFSGVFKENTRVKGMYLLQRSYKVFYKPSKYMGSRGCNHWVGVIAQIINALKTRGWIIFKATIVLNSLVSVELSI